MRSCRAFEGSLVCLATGNQGASILDQEGGDIFPHQLSRTPLPKERTGNHLDTTGNGVISSIHSPKLAHKMQGGGLIVVMAF